MQPVNFLYSNLRLDPAPGDEATVCSMHAYRGPNGITAAWQLSTEEIEMINKTGVIWTTVSSREWAPMKVAATVPAFDFGFNDVQLYDYLAHQWREADGWTRFGVIQYLDLSFMYLTVPEQQTAFIFQHVDPREFGISPDSIGLQQDAKVWDLTYIDEEKSRSQRQQGRYLFSEALVVCGRLKDLPKLAPFMEIHPFLKPEMLVLMQKAKQAPQAPQAPAKIITLGK